MSLEIREENCPDGIVYIFNHINYGDRADFFDIAGDHFNSVISSIIAKRIVIKINASLNVTFLEHREVSEYEVCEVEHFQEVYIQTRAVELGENIEQFYEESIVMCLWAELDRRLAHINDPIFHEVNFLDITVIEA